MPTNDHLTVQTEPRSPTGMDRTYSRNDDTPTNETPRPLALNTSLDYSPVEQPFTAINDQPQFDGRQLEWDDEYQQYQEQPGHGYPDYPSHTNYAPESPESPVEMPRPLGGLRIANRTSTTSDTSDWAGSALKDLNLNQ